MVGDHGGRARVEGGELVSGGFEVGVLLGGGLLWRAEGFPEGEGVAVGFIDPVVGDFCLAKSCGKPGDFQEDCGVGAGQVVVMIVPDEHAEFVAGEAGEGGDVGFVADAAAEDFRQGNGRVAGHREAVAIHFRKHPEDVHDRLVDSVSRERAEAGEIRLVLELEGPGQRAFQIHAVFGGEIEFARKGGGGVAGIHGAVPIGEVRPLAGGASFRIGLADDDGRVGEFRIAGDDGEGTVDVAELAGNAHLHAAVDVARFALRVEGNEIRGRAGLAGGGVFSLHAVVEKALEEIPARTAGEVGTADFRSGDGAADRLDRVVVEFEELVAGAAPVTDVWLVPGLPIPLEHLVPAVFLHRMFRPLIDKLLPLRPVLRRIGPAGVDFVVFRCRRPVVAVGLGFHRECFGHEADLHVRPHAALQIGIEDAVDDFPIVNRIPLRVLGVGVGGSPLESMRALSGD